MRKLSYLTIVLTALAALAGCGADDDPGGPGRDPAPQITLETSAASLAVGEEVLLTIRIDGVTDFHAATFSVAFDTTLISLDHLELDEMFLGGDRGLSFVVRTDTGVSVGVGRTGEVPDAPPGSAGVLALLTLQGRAAGTTAVDVEDLSLVDAHGEPCPDTDAMEPVGIMLEVAVPTEE